MSRLQKLLEDLKIWNKSLKDEDCFPNTVDVDNMYPTLSMYIVEQALKEALSTCSDYNKDLINYIITLCKRGLNKIPIQFPETYYKQKTGIIARDNNPVRIANMYTSGERSQKKQLFIKIFRLLFFSRFCDD